MKNFTLKACLLGAALGSFADVSAQGILQFETNYDEFVFQQKYNSHRATPLFADFNGDGIMDVYYAGTSCTDGWICRAALMKGLGSGQYEFITDA